MHKWTSKYSFSHQKWDIILVQSVSKRTMGNYKFLTLKLHKQYYVHIKRNVCNSQVIQYKTFAVNLKYQSSFIADNRFYVWIIILVQLCVFKYHSRIKINECQLENLKEMVYMF